MEEVLILPSFDGICEHWSYEQLHFLEYIDIVSLWIVNRQIRIVNGSVEEVIGSIECWNVDVEGAIRDSVDWDGKRLNGWRCAPSTVNCDVDVHCFNQIPSVRQTKRQCQHGAWNSGEGIRRSQLDIVDLRNVGYNVGIELNKVTVFIKHGYGQNRHVKFICTCVGRRNDVDPDR